MDRQTTAFPNTSASMAEAPGKRIPWWLWPNLLSLDAPAVALVWYWAFHHLTGELEVPWDAPYLLTLAVWCIYVGDRLWDVRRMANPNLGTARHCFYARHQLLFAGLLVLALLSGAVVAILTLPLYVWLVASGVGFGVAIYFWQLQAKLLVPKELACGVVFALGVICPLVEYWSTELFLHAGIFAMLCCANCLAIGLWERKWDARNDTNALPQHRWFNRTWLWGMLGAIAVAGICLGTMTGVCLSLSAVLLGALLGIGRWCSLDLLRLLADTVLLTPLLFYLYSAFAP